ncbi:MAG: hypothetical protein ACTH31_07590, partial [Pseudoclavibacter sp.]
ERDDAPAFGIFDVAGGRPDSMPSTWTVYFLTADADRDVERAVSLGARLTFGPEDSVYGRMATFVDPMGAAFNLIEPPLPEPATGAAAPGVVDELPDVPDAPEGQDAAVANTESGDDSGGAAAETGDGPDTAGEPSGDAGSPGDVTPAQVTVEDDATGVDAASGDAIGGVPAAVEAEHVESESNAQDAHDSDDVGETDESGESDELGEVDGSDPAEASESDGADESADGDAAAEPAEGTDGREAPPAP